MSWPTASRRPTLTAPLRWSSALEHISVLAPAGGMNLAPYVDAGGDQVVHLPASNVAHLLRHHDLLKRNWHRGNNYLPSVGPPPISFTSVMDGAAKIRIDDPVDGLIMYHVDNDQLREWATKGLRNLGIDARNPLLPVAVPGPVTAF